MMTSTSSGPSTVGQSLGTQQRAGRYLDVLCSDPAQALIAAFVGGLLTPESQQKKASASATTAATATATATGTATGTGPTHNTGVDNTTTQQDRVAVGLAVFNAFLQANVTGPVLDVAGVHRVDDSFLSAAQKSGLESEDSKSSKGREAQLLVLRRACLTSLDVDGVSVYPHIPHIELFCLARFIFTAGLVSSIDAADNAVEGAETSLQWLALRIHVWHYKLLTQPSLGPGSVFTKGAQWSDLPSLHDTIEQGLASVEKEVVTGSDGSRWSTRSQAELMVEKANVCIMLGQDLRAKETLRQATELSGLAYAVSGALGKRTKFQQSSTSQLVVLAKSRDAEAGQKEADEAQKAKPQALALNDDTLLESLQFTKEETETGEVGNTSALPAALKDLLPDEQPQLSPLDQIILLTEATLKDSFSPADSLTSEEILPYAVRVISDKSTNWQIYTQALLVRSRIEMHRSRTIERGVMQLQAIVDQVVVDTTAAAPEVGAQTAPALSDTAIPSIQVTADGESGSKKEPAPVVNKPTSFFPAPKPSESASAPVRLQYIHVLSSPPRWHLESELAYSWVGVGSLISALEIFKRLRLWAEVALCLASSAARSEEDGRGSSDEARAKAVLRWRLFRKTGSSQEQTSSDEELDVNIDILQLREADYHGPERRPPPHNAPRLFCILGDINNEPAHYERAWDVSKQRFARAQRSLGEYYIKQQDLEKAREAYQKAIGVNRLSSEMWNRLGDINLRLGNFSEAADAFGRAIASSDNTAGGDDSRTWSNLGSALYSLYIERVKEARKEKDEQEREGEREEDSNNAVDDSILVSQTTPPRQDPATLLSQSLAAYKRGASAAHDNWRIWDNVITLGSRLRPPAVSDIVLALQNVIRIRSSEDALDVDVLRLLLNEAVLSKPKPGDTADGATGVFEPPRGTTERAVCELIEKEVVPLITARSELWELVARERVWKRDYVGVIDAAERAWRAAVGSAGGGGGGLLPASGGSSGKNWIEDKEAWLSVVARTDELVSALENYGPEAPEIGTRWKGRARSAIRSVLGKAREAWEGSQGWEQLQALLEGLK